MSRVDAEAPIGSNLKITLVNGKVYEGAVFSFEPKQSIVLVNNCNSPKPIFNVLNVSFIKSVEPSTKSEPLAPGVVAGAKLPKLFENFSRESVAKLEEVKTIRDKDITQKVNVENNRASISIGALDVLMKLIPAWKSSTVWDEANQCFIVSDKIHVKKSESGSWANPIVCQIHPDPEDKSMETRIRAVFAKK